jgi:hypothetical protein
MKTLKEAEYRDFFSKDTLAKLNKKSADNLKVMLTGGLTKAMTETPALLRQIQKIEKPYINELELLAEVIVKDVYGIVNDNQIQIQASIVQSVNLQNIPTQEELPEEVSFPEEAKRRIINSITQGGSVRGAFSFYLFKEYLDSIDPTLVDTYGKLLNNVFGIYDDDNAIAMLLSMVASGSSSAGGESEGYYDEEKDIFVIKAQGINFPILVHEIIKGLYEIVAIEGFTSDPEKNKQIIKTVDKVGNEPEDLRYGKFIYDAINNLVSSVSTKDSRIREYFISEIYKLPDAEFINFIESLETDFVKNKVHMSDEELYYMNKDISC